MANKQGTELKKSKYFSYKESGDCVLYRQAVALVNIIFLFAIYVVVICIIIINSSIIIFYNGH